jgi:hypothetical protein
MHTYYSLNVLLELDTKYDITEQQWVDIWDCVWADNTSPDKGIAQGNPLSPMVSNLVGFFYIDRFLRNGNNGLREDHSYWRYSDNIFIAVKRDSNYNRENFLGNLHLLSERRINSSYQFKFKIKSSNQTNIALGIRFGRKSHPQDKKWLRSVFHRYASQGEGLAKHQDIIEEYGKLSREALKQLMYGLKAYALDVEPGMAAYVNQKLGVSNGS